MASYNELLALIDAYINQNGVQAITGQVLNGVLRAMVDQLGRGYAIMGAADPTTDPGTPDGPETWFASVPGTYTNFDGIQIVPGELALLSYEPSTGFSKNTIYEGFQTVQATIDGNVGTPAVGVSYANGILSFDFHNMKGVTGDPAGFGAVTASVDSNIGTPSVQVQTSGPDTAKAIAFQFHNLKGETGVTSVLATVDNTSGNPQCAVSLNGQQLVLNFTGLKGAQGDTGSSVDYPFTIVNNLTTNDATQALSAAMGVQLETEVSQLEAKVDDLSTGKYYGYFAQEEDLPEADVDGFAYVGEGPTYTIYNLRGGVWTSSNITVNQSPIGNDEDIDQNEDGKLQFANRTYNSLQPNGMGYKILRKDATFASQVTDTNTIYEVRYNFNLGGVSTTIPAGCVLYFNGGSINNGAVNFNNAKIESESPCFDGITPTGLPVISAEWFGITPESVDISTKFNALCASFTERETIKFKPEVYQTSATLVFNHTGSYAANREFSIVGNPIFFCNTANITCISLTGVNMGKLEFRVHRAYPAKWGDNGSIGVLLVNVLRTTIKISEIKYFTYGIICRADGAGFAWNNIYVPHIYCALQSFVVECVNGGWPNANNVTGGIGGARNSGLCDVSGATEPIRTIVFKSDGTYAPNGWNFDGLWLEANASDSPAIGGKDYVPIDLSDYCSSIDGTAHRFVDMNFSGRFEVHTPIIKVRRSSIARKLNLVGYNIGSGNQVAIDENGVDVTGTVVSVIGYESTHIFLDRVEYDSQDDIIGSPRIPSGKSYLGGLSYGKLNLCYGQFGYSSKNAVFSIVGGVQILIKRRTYCSLNVIFFDGEMQHIHPNDALWKPVGYPNSLRVNAPSGSSYRPYLTNNDGTTDETFLLLSNSPVKYVAIGADSRGDIEIYQVKNPRLNTPICKKAFPFGIGDVNTHYGNDAITSLRCWVKEGQIYVDNTGKMYKFIRSGSLGTTTITASGNAGENFITASGTSSLFVGDYITIGSEKFRIVSINTTTKVLTLDGTLASNHNGEQISFTQPTYSLILPDNVVTTSGRPTLTSADAGTMCFDKTLSKPIWWAGTNWIDATGATV